MLIVSRTVKTVCLFCSVCDSAQLGTVLTPLSYREEWAHNRPFPQSVFLKFIKILIQQVELGTQDAAFLTSSPLMLILLFCRYHFVWQGKTIKGDRQECYSYLQNFMKIMEKTDIRCSDLKNS